MRVIEYKSRPGLGVCGQGMHYHPAHVAISLTGAKLKVTTADGKVSFRRGPAGPRVLLPTLRRIRPRSSAAPARASIIVEMKGKDWKPSTG